MAPAPGASAGVRPERALERPPGRVEVGPLSVGALQRILRTRTSVDASRRTLQRIHETSGGNPFYALELARVMEGDAAVSGGGGARRRHRAALTRQRPRAAPGRAPGGAGRPNS